MDGKGVEAINGKPLVTYTDLEEATGKTRRTLYNDTQRGLLTKPDARGVWLANEPYTYQALCDYITGKSGPGQGARTDLRK